MNRMKIIYLCCFISMMTTLVANTNRWVINSSGGITWNIDSRIPHQDHIEMSGLQVSTVLRYGVTGDGTFTLERSLVWPMLRTIPNNTHASLMRRFAWDITDMIAVNGRSVGEEKVHRITLDGILKVESSYTYPREGEMELVRYIFPSTTKPVLCEKYVLRNSGKTPLNVEVPDTRSVIQTDPEKGVAGSYTLVSSLRGFPGRVLSPGDSIVFYADFAGYKTGQEELTPNIEHELAERRSLINELWSNLVLETPDETLNTMFAFAKIRGSESIYDTSGGLMHGPGGESYYAAIWANDQAEYINPFFPFLGYSKGNESALNSFRHFMRFMNDQYEKIPSSIISEGIDIWAGAGDRGDAAMVAYGAARYALARGDKEEARELWDLIEWTLEYCRRNLNEEGVVKSDSDELEGRFPAGDANLCTSSLYYDALLSAVYLGKDLGKPASQLKIYSDQAKALKKAIETYFGGTVEGFNTYKYYKENDILRSWICIPLTVGIYDRKEATIDALFSPRLWTENGLLTQAGSETFWDRSTLYALRGVFACGETTKGMDYLKFYSAQRLLGEHVPYAIEAWPEGSQRHLSAESGLYGRIITEGLFGIRPTGLRSFTVTPRLPSDWNEMALKNINAFGTTFNIEVNRKNKKVEVKVIREGKVYRQKSIQEGDSWTISL